MMPGEEIVEFEGKRYRVYTTGWYGHDITAEEAIRAVQELGPGVYHRENGDVPSWLTRQIEHYNCIGPSWSHFTYWVAKQPSMLVIEVIEF